MKKINISVAALSVLCAGTNVQAFNTGEVIGFDAGVAECVIGGTYPVCDYGLSNVTSGSYFAMDLNGSGTIEPNEKTPISPGINGGIIVGQLMPADVTGICSEYPGLGGVDEPWCFGGNYGAHQILTTPVTDNGNGTLDFSGWSVKWNDGDVPLYGGTAVLSCSSMICHSSDIYSIDYSTTIPTGGFMGVQYALHLESTAPAANISLTPVGGDTHECSTTGGANVVVNSTVNLPDGDSVESIEWSVDNTVVSSGNQFSNFVQLGTHTVAATLTTYNGLVANAETQVTVSDTSPPVVIADLIDRVVDAPLDMLGFTNYLKVDAEGIDVCDPAPSVEAMYGAITHDDASLVLINYYGKAVFDIPAFDLTVRATDSSGNTNTETRTVQVTQ